MVWRDERVKGNVVTVHDRKWGGEREREREGERERERK